MDNERFLLYVLKIAFLIENKEDRGFVLIIFEIKSLTRLKVEYDFLFLEIKERWIHLPTDDLLLLKKEAIWRIVNLLLW